MTEWLIFALIGVLTGLLSGLLGLGGGLIVVPCLLTVFALMGYADTMLMHMAVATSLATITVTSLASIYTHAQLDNINWSIVKRLSPSLMVGSFIGAYCSLLVSSDGLQLGFAVYAIIIAIKINYPAPVSLSDRLLEQPTVSVAGGVIGSVSALIGIGGGSLTVPYFLMAKQTMSRAVGTAAMCGLPISISAVLAFMLLEQNSDVELSLIHWPAFLGIVSTSIIFAVVGAKLTRVLPVSLLKKIFSVVLLVMGCYLLIQR
ncbi:MAG: permease [Gammaproteobacteria bacterium]|nr:MAG: permease [Gammaproteobacteria bacterium]